VRALGGLLLLLLTALGVWLASALVAYAGGPAWLACVGGVLLFPVLPLWWEHRATEAFYAQLKRATRLLPKKRALTPFTRVALRTVFLNLVFVGALLGLWPRVAFAALATRGDWFLGDARSQEAEVTRRALLAAAGGLEWLHRAANDNPYRTPEDARQPIPETVRSVVATVTTPHGSGARWRRAEHPTPEPQPSPDPAEPLPSRPVPEPAPSDAVYTVGATSWPWADTVHPVVSGMTAADEASPEAVARSIAARVTDPFERVKALHDWLVTRLRYDTASTQGSGHRAPQDAQSVFLSRKAVCEGYARLFVELGRHTGDPVRYVTGEVRERDGSLAAVGHAWNAVEVRGAWYLIDATWDDPTMDSGEDAYHTDYLFIPPDLAILNHFPDEPAWQLRAAPLSRAEFLRQPVATTGLAREHIALQSPTQGRVQVGDTFELQLDNPARRWVSVRVDPERRQCGPSNDATLRISCPVSERSETAHVFVNDEPYGTFRGAAQFTLQRR
jgi:transglutaminase-like putative cysteine protease